MEDVDSYVHYINTLLKNIKFNLHVKYIWLCIEDIAVMLDSHLGKISDYFHLIQE